mmetsp:Transcript_88959/g.237236  ORF Transcript_88959/g.237236 Transcript_88959/m.237236 type:complete len:202 (+) Transcript_88959:2184-2789(+)
MNWRMTSKGRWEECRGRRKPCPLRRSRKIPVFRKRTEWSLRPKRSGIVSWKSGCGLMPSSGLGASRRRGESGFSRRRRGWKLGSRRGRVRIRNPLGRRRRGHGARRRRGRDWRRRRHGTRRMRRHGVRRRRGLGVRRRRRRAGKQRSLYVVRRTRRLVVKQRSLHVVRRTRTLFVRRCCARKQKSNLCCCPKLAIFQSSEL